MWGSWFGVLVTGALLLAGLVGLAFGTSIAVFGIFIALGLAAAIAVGFGLMRASEHSGHSRSPVAGAQQRSPRSGGAPAAGEGAPASETAPAPHEPAGSP